MLDKFSVALGEYDTGWHDPARSLREVKKLAGKARDAGARLLVLPEMCTTGFTMDAPNRAEPIDGESVRRLGDIARDHSIWLIAGVATRSDGVNLNSAIALAPSGDTFAVYHKQKLFGYASEDTVYSTGTGPCVFALDGVSVALFVVFDLRFPELFREVAREADVMVVIANWPTTRQKHWEILTQARAIENQCYLVAVNRTGRGGGLDYAGGSVILDPWGNRCDREIEGGISIGEVGKQRVAEVRKNFPIGNSPSRAVSTR